MRDLVQVVDDKLEKTYLVDKDTGEVQCWRYSSNLKWWYCNPKDEPLWGKVYWGHMDLAADFFTGKAEFFFRLMSHVEAGGRIVLSDDLETSMLEQCRISKRTFTNYLNQLSKDGLIFKTKGSWRGTYWVNPFIFGFGKWDACRKQQKAFKDVRDIPDEMAGSACVDDTGGIGGDSPDDVLPVEPCEGQA